MSDQQLHPAIAERIDEVTRTGATKLDLSAMRLSAVPEAVRALDRLQYLDLSNNTLNALPLWLGESSHLETLHLSRNQLETIPDWVRMLPNLRMLTLHDNRLETLPQWLSECRHLLGLTIGGNRLGDLPEWLVNFTQLEELGISGFELIEIPGWLHNFNNLQSLDVSQNRLTILPEWLVSFAEQLTTLKIGGNNLEKLPIWLSACTKLKILDLGGLYLGSIPEWLSQFEGIQSLHLSSNQLSAVPEVLGKLTSLRTLHLSSNQLSAVPEVLGKLTSLRTLYLSSNQLSAVPEVLGKLTSLQELNLSSNQLSVLPEVLGKLTSLRTLYLSSNQLSVLPEVLGKLTNLQSLYLQNNQLSVLPEVLGKLTSLRTLDLSSNQLSVVPEVLGKLTSLQLLNLQNNQLSAVPEVLGKLTNLHTLSLYGNQFETLPNWLGGLTKLRFLDIDGSSKKELPTWLGNLTKLETLDIRNNQLSAVPEVLGKLTSLRTLDLSSNQLSAVPEVLGKLTSLRTLYLSSNQLSAVPEVLGKLTSLQELHLQNNQLSAVPEVLGKLTNLHTLDLSSNQLSAVPEVLGKLTSLRTLDLSSNQLSAVPEVLGKLTNLQSLHLSSNQLSAVPEVLGKLTSLRTLDLQNNQLSAVPEVLGKLTNLQSLHLSSNQLSAVPEVLGKLTSLRTLDLQNNQLSAVPEVLGKLTNLQSLHLSSNQLSAVPEVLGKLTSLRTLNLQNNQLSAVPEVLGKLTSLQSLHLQNNQLSAVPEVLGKLTNLQSLDLSSNQLSVMPEVLGKLTSLQLLNLQNNQLSAVPEVLGKLTNLQSLHLSSNPLTDLPTSIVRLTRLQSLGLADNRLYPEIEASYTQGTDALMRYLQARAQGEVALHEAKLVLVGEGEVGKSSLLSALRGDPWVEGRLTTHGIEIKDVPLAGSNGSEGLMLKGWDFGGQPIYRPTHQLFFSAPAVYLVVWKPREGPNQSFVYYWIELIKHRTYDETRPDQRPRVIVVATHGGPKQRQPHIDEQLLRSQFGDMIVDFCQVDSKSREGIAELKAMIAAVAAEIPQVGRKVPASSKRVIEAVQKRSKRDPYISYTQFEQLCKRQQVDKELAALYATILNELGYCIHYGDDEALRDVVVLKADWLTKAISFVLEDPEVIKQNGLVRHERLSLLWHDAERPSMERYPTVVHPLFLRLMERFDLSYRVELEGTPPTSLIAQLVPGQRPEGFHKEWSEVVSDGERQLVQVCRIVDGESGEPVMVPSIFYQLIVRLHRFSLGKENYKLSIHWQNGLLLDDSYNGRAFVEQVRNGIRVTVRAAYPDGFLHYICSDVVWLIDHSWKGLNCQITVPCPQPNCQGLIEREALIKSRKQNRPEYPCGACKEWIAIDTLLPVSVSLPDPRKMHAEVIDRLSEIKQTVDTGFQSASVELRKLLSQADEQFTKLMTALVDEAREGPRLFSIVPVSSGNWGRGRWATEKVRLTLWCEHSRLPVPILSGDASKGVYEIERPREWLVKIAPYARFAAGALSLALPVAGAAMKWSLDQQMMDAHAKDLELSEASFGALLGASKAGGEWLAPDDTLDAPDDNPDAKSGIQRLLPGSQDAFLVESAQEHGDLTRLEGAPLRELQALLKERDKTFGGLERVQNNRREFLWVHPNYKKIYNPDLPEFPQTGAA